MPGAVRATCNHSRLYLILSVVFFVLNELLSYGSMPTVHADANKLPNKADCANLKSDRTGAGSCCCHGSRRRA